MLVSPSLLSNAMVWGDSGWMPTTRLRCHSGLGRQHVPRMLAWAGHFAGVYLWALGLVWANRQMLPSHRKSALLDLETHLVCRIASV